MAFITIASNREQRMPRAEIKAALRTNGFDRQAADEIADLAIHAAGARWMRSSPRSKSRSAEMFE